MTRLIVVVALLFAAAVSGRMMPMAHAAVAVAACPDQGQSDCHAARYRGNAHPMRSAGCHATTCLAPMALPILPTASPAPGFTPMRYTPGVPSRGTGLSAIPDAPPPRADALD